MLQSAAGDKEVWQCKIYRLKGRKACSAPQIRSEELNQILAQIFAEMMKDKDAIIDSLITVLTHVPKEVDYERMLAHVEGEIAATKQKKDRLLDLHIAGAITIEEFKERNDGLNDQLKAHESQLAAIRQEQSKANSKELDMAEVYTHDTNLKKRMRKYAKKYPELCRLTDNDGQGGLRFEIDKSRISIRLTAPYTDDRRKAASELAKKRGIHTKRGPADKLLMRPNLGRINYLPDRVR